MLRPLCLLLALCALPCPAADLPRADAPCEQTAETARWTSAGTPDLGRRPPLISAHRGGVNLAPENTLWAYRHAFAYGMDFVEIDVRESLDGVLYSMHDDDVARTTGGSGNISTMLSSQIDALNAANFEPWIGSEYDPSPVPRLDDILALARDSQRGIEFDIKFVKNYLGFFQKVQDYGLMQRSYFNMSGFTVSLSQLLYPELRVIYNIDDNPDAQTAYDETGRSIIYGSAMDKFTPELIAAIHDGCSYVLPHSYDDGHEYEAAEFLHGLAMGADGAQSNQPDVIRALLKAPLAVKLAPGSEAEAGSNSVCLSNAENGLGLPRKTLSYSRRDGREPGEALSNRYGCISLPGAAQDYLVRFAGDASAEAAQYNQLDTPPPAAAPTHTEGGSLPLLASLLYLLIAALRRRTLP
jgi:hypothetical protein